ncbi:MAG: hypothetical protein ACO1OF_15255 [Adhaeribacter sp.]
MEKTVIARTNWHPAQQLIITQISGDVDADGVAQWGQSLQEALSQIPDNHSFKILINLHGFTATNFAAHKQFRVIIPQTLANYGWKTGYVNLFEEAASLQLHNVRGIKCVAAAHVHQDKTKIEKYESMFGKENEHFFTDPEQAETWIKSFPV